jgi:hypothetical protein
LSDVTGDLAKVWAMPDRRTAGRDRMRPVVDETRAATDEKRPIIEVTARDVDAHVLIAEVLNYDLAQKPLDEPFRDDESAELSF